MMHLRGLVVYTCGCASVCMNCGCGFKCTLTINESAMQVLAGLPLLLTQ